MKIVINACFGGFSVSESVFKALGVEYSGNGRLDNYFFNIKSSNDEAYRSCERLIMATEVAGEGASGRHANLKIVEIPDGIDWYIHEYNGMESVHEAHRYWD